VRPPASAPSKDGASRARGHPSGVAGRSFFAYQMCAVAAAPTILVFDSGLGGLTVFREVLKARPDARYLYVADDAFFPYGGHGEAELVARVVALMGELIETHRPDLIVIACNTALVNLFTCWVDAGPAAPLIHANE